MNQFSIQDQWLFYLEKTQQSEPKMHPIQLSETKRAFYAAWGQLLIVMRDEISKLPDEDGIKELDSMVTECNYYWQNEIRKRKET